MTDFSKKTYYFKMVGKNVWPFRVDTFTYEGYEPLVQLTCLYKNISASPTTKSQMEKFLNELMTKYSFKYVEVNDTEEIERLKLLYEA